MSVFRTLASQGVAAYRRRLLAVLVLFSITFGTLALPGGLYVSPAVAEAATSELFLSEYIEGSSNNKALEIYNGTGSAIDLAANGYNVQMFFNGSVTAGTSINLSGTVAAGDVFVLAQALANATIQAQADQTSTASWYNGDDAVVLRKGTTVIDSIGQIGFDPGTEWGTGLTSTADNTLRRKSSICAGETVSNDVFDPAAEWDGFATDTFDGLGSHTAACDDPSTNPSGTGAASPNVVPPGESSLLTVTVTPGTNPTSTGLTVTGDLSSIGGSALQQFFDDGTNGDAIAGNNVFSFSATVPNGTATGAKSLAVTITDAQARSGNTSIALTVIAPPDPQPLPFVQNWSNTNLITTNNNWSGVPGIVGYRGDGLVGTTAVDPQTVLQDGAGTPINVNANQANPNSFTSGGVTEFAITNPVVALQGSGTADAPHMVVSVDTTGLDNITMFYNLRDIDGSNDNSVQPVALHYRIGATGNFTNVPAAYVADASSGPAEASLVTPVAVLLPPAANNKPLVQFRIMTTDAIGSDEWIGIDDIQVVSGGTIPLSGSGSASPNVLDPGDSTLLTVNAYPATNPTSTGISATADLSSIGGSSAQQFFDDGTNGDVTPADNVFSFTATLSADAFNGTLTIPVSLSDVQNRSGATAISITVRAARTPDIHLTMGNPSNATTDVNFPLNYLLQKNEWVASYNRDRGIPNWVSWHLDSSWIGSAPRQDDFRPDDSLPLGWYQVTTFDYTNSGFNRGHHCPSGDRTATIPENSATFFMTNMMPQAPGNNQGPWEQLESFSRSIANQGNELYITMGGSGSGGTGDKGGTTHTIADGKVTVPAVTWKVIIALPTGGNDVSRVSDQTRTLAVIMPNNDEIRPDAWQKYISTIDQVEALTGYDFLSNVPADIQSVIESRLDPQSNTAPVANGQTVGTDEDTPLAITLTATDPNVNNVLAFSIITPPAHGTLSGTGANQTYTPDADYNGPDSFMFQVSDGASTSTATVSINVGSVNDAPVLAPIADQTVYLGNTLSFTATATDVDLPNDTLAFSLTGTAPAGAVIDPATGEFSWTPTLAQAGQIHTFGVRVTDAGGLYHDQTVNVGVAYEWTNVFGAVSADGTSTFRRGTRVPVKFKLTGLAAAVTDAEARLFIAPVVNGVVGTESPATSTGGSTSGNLFRYDSKTGEYVFNLDTSGLSPGLYRLRIDLGDGVERTVLITVR